MKKPGAVLVALFLIVLGLGSIVWKQSLPKDFWLDPYLSEISSAFLAGGLLSILYKIFTEREQRDELRHLFGIHKSVEEAGLDEVLAASQNYDFTQFLRRNTSIALVMNDGERWIGNYAVALRDRFSKAGCSTVVFTVDPDGIALPVLASKVGKPANEQKGKIETAWSLLKQAWNASDKLGSLKVSAASLMSSCVLCIGVAMRISA